MWSSRQTFGAASDAHALWHAPWPPPPPTPYVYLLIQLVLARHEGPVLLEAHNQQRSRHNKRRAELLINKTGSLGFNTAVRNVKVAYASQYKLYYIYYERFVWLHLIWWMIYRKLIHESHRKRGPTLRGPGRLGSGAMFTFARGQHCRILTSQLGSQHTLSSFFLCFFFFYSLSVRRAKCTTQGHVRYYSQSLQSTYYYRK